MSYGGSSLVITMAALGVLLNISKETLKMEIESRGMQDQAENAFSFSASSVKDFAEIFRMKVVIAGGGTGGHLYPGIAIARELLRESGNEVLFVGTEQGIEAKVLPREGLPVRFISVGKLKGMRLASIMKTMVTLPRSLCQSLRLLREVRPDVVDRRRRLFLGPGCPRGVGPQDPASDRGAELLCRACEPQAGDDSLTGSSSVFPGPERSSFSLRRKRRSSGRWSGRGSTKGDREKALAGFGLEPGRFTVFVMGGSGGAHAINMAMKEAARVLRT